MTDQSLRQPDSLEQYARPGENKINEGLFRSHLSERHTRGNRWGRFFYIANFIGLGVLIILVLHILNSTFGLVVIRNTIEPSALSDRPLNELTETELLAIIAEQQPNRLPVYIRDYLSVVPNADFTAEPLKDALATSIVPEAYQDLTIGQVPLEGRIQILADNLDQSTIHDIVVENVVRPVVVRSWQLIDSVTNRAAIEALAAERFPDGQLQFRNWLTPDFVSSNVSSSATTAGLRTALLGSFYIIIITASLALIVGVAAAIYLEEYANRENWLERVIEINIRNLAAIPSIIYGMLGLAVFAQALSIFTGGYLLGANLPSQSEDVIVIEVRQAFGLGGLSNAEREMLNNSVNRTDTEAQAIQIMIGEIGEETSLTNEELRRLIGTFFGYRVASMGNISFFSSPNPDQALRDISAAVDISKLTPAQIEALQTALIRYGTFNINGRTVLSAAITLAMLILPLIIVNAQEAIRAVPRSIREASYGMGATRWQTVSRQVLPAALPGILTGVILAVSRAIGETAPLLVVGASTFIGINPNGPFSKFTVVPIQIYQWTSRPEQEFRSVAAAAIIVLLFVMLTSNGLAIYIRNRYSQKY